MSQEKEGICEVPRKQSCCVGKSEQNFDRRIESFERIILSARWIRDLTLLGGLECKAFDQCEN